MRVVFLVADKVHAIIGAAAKLEPQLLAVLAPHHVEHELLGDEAMSRVIWAGSHLCHDLFGVKL